MSNVIKVRVGTRWYTVEVPDLDTRPVRALVDGEPVEVEVGDQGDAVAPTKEATPGSTASAAPSSSAGRVFRSPMAGIVVSLSVGERDKVGVGDEICVIEAMKMQQSLRADFTGTITRVFASEGEQLPEGGRIVEYG